MYTSIDRVRRKVSYWMLFMSWSTTTNDEIIRGTKAKFVAKLVLIIRVSPRNLHSSSKCAICDSNIKVSWRSIKYKSVVAGLPPPLPTAASMGVIPAQIDDQKWSLVRQLEGSGVIDTHDHRLRATFKFYPWRAANHCQTHVLFRKGLPKF